MHRYVALADNECMQVVVQCLLCYVYFVMGHAIVINFVTGSIPIPKAHSSSKMMKALIHLQIT